MYLAIIALWVMFLIPWLGRHRDEHNGRKTADRYHRAMDTLARAGHSIRHPRDDDDALTDEETSEFEATDPVTAPSVAIPGLRDGWRTITAALVPSVADRRSTAAKRRRRVLLLLAAGLSLAIAGAVAGLLPSIVAVLVAGLLAGYLALLVRQASRAGLGATGQRSASAETDRYREATRRAQAQARGLLHPQQRAASAAQGWDAVPATLPTYVTKPKASKVPRVVDLTSTHRGWTGEQMVQRAQEERRRTQDAAREQFEREMAALRPDPVEEVAELANPTEQASYQPRPSYRRAANG